MKEQISTTKIEALDWSGLMNHMYHEDSSLEMLSLKSKYNGYQISFYATPDDNYQLYVEDFGFEIDGNWVQLEPTIDQIMTMEDALAKELQRLYDVEDEKDIEAIRKAQHAKDEIIDRETLNHNFYRSF